MKHLVSLILPITVLVIGVCILVLTIGSFAASGRATLAPRRPREGSE